MSVVVDASFAVFLGVSGAGPSTGTGPRAFSQLELKAPPIFWHEVASALRGMVSRREIDRTRRSATLDGIRLLGITLEAAPPRIERVIEVSDRYQLTIYDAAYLELAIRTGSELATRDGGLIKAAPRASVGLITELN